ncbi:MAG: branched-chain amino acid ABC transporter permease [Rhizobiaceae bacterium]|nr:branched-chain amino acid ABC transporter permease [Rhizobiaceae bacterium]MBL4732113.1 branched-chain amino acid ABC transporter permease [Rhizobiaceae bacterium]
MAYEMTLITTMAISVLFALSLNFISGFCGQISLGHAAFLGTGAYTSAMMTKASIPFLLTLPAAAITAAILGFIIGLTSLRVRHDFLAITTMGTGFLFVGLIRQQEFFGGEIGIAGIPSTGLGREGFMALCIGLAALFAIFSIRVRRSWMGFVYDSIADNEDITRILGINASTYKLIAFVIGTATAGVAGALYAHHFRFIGPDSFGFVESMSVLAMVIVGGIGSTAGVIVSAAVMSVMPLLFQFIDDYKLLLYSALLFFMMRFSPDGLAGLCSRTYDKIRRRRA